LEKNIRRKLAIGKGTFSQRKIARSICVIAVVHVQMPFEGAVHSATSKNYYQLF
jgi:hypothetical protein